jgi:hypothetical protein
LYAETARGLVKKAVVAAAAGLRGINIGNLEDWKTGLPEVDKAAVPSLGASMFMGLADTTITQQRPGGPLPYSGHLFSQARRVGALRPGFYALQLVWSKIGTFTTVAPCQAGEHVWCYRFERPTGSLWVLWYDDGQLYLPGAMAPTTTVTLPFPAAKAWFTNTPTVLDQSMPETSFMTGITGSLLFNINNTPLFVEVGP